MIKNYIKKTYGIIFLFRSIIPIFSLLIDRKLKEIAMKDLERLDYESIYGNLNSILFFNYSLLTNKCYRRIFHYRLKRQGHLVLLFLSRVLLPERKDIDMWGDIEPGFCIFHGVGDVIVCHKAGKNFSVYQNVTIGKNYRKVVNGVDTPSFGDNVSVYANSVVIGGITIGNNVKIGAGSVVTKDVPDNCTVVGNPMRIIMHKDKV